MHVVFMKVVTQKNEKEKMGT